MHWKESPSGFSERYTSTIGERRLLAWTTIGNETRLRPGLSFVGSRSVAVQSPDCCNSLAVTCWFRED